MNEKQIQKIIPQTPGESDASYKRLLLYIQSPCKNLIEFEKYLQTNHPQKHVALSTLQNCSAHDNWTARVKKVTEQQDHEIQEELQQLFKDLNTRGMHDMQTFLDELETVKNKEMQLFHTGKKPSSVMFTLHNYIKCYREATEIYYINSRHKLEPEEEKDTTPTPDEITINHNLLSDDNMQEQLTILQKILEDKK